MKVIIQRPSLPLLLVAIFLEIPVVKVAPRTKKPLEDPAVQSAPDAATPHPLPH